MSTPSCLLQDSRSPGITGIRPSGWKLVLSVLSSRPNRMMIHPRSVGLGGLFQGTTCRDQLSGCSGPRLQANGHPMPELLRLALFWTLPTFPVVSRAEHLELELKGPWHGEPIENFFRPRKTCPRDLLERGTTEVLIRNSVGLKWMHGRAPHWQTLCIVIPGSSR